MSGEDSSGIWLIRPGVDTEPRRLINNGFGPVWNSDGTILYFARIGAGAGLYEFDLRTNQESQIREWKQIPYFDVVGERLAYCELGSIGKNRVYSMYVE
jgi:hypothetical protein